MPLHLKHSRGQRANRRPIVRLGTRLLLGGRSHHSTLEIDELVE
jgi:hypothetical protein